MRNRFLPYAAPDITEDEIGCVVESLRNGWLTTGPRAAALEEAFARSSGVKYAIALNSCTAALHLGLRSIGAGRGDEVITPSFTFVAGAQCIVETGAQPVFCDVELSSMSIAPETIEPLLTERTKAIVVLPYAGRPLGIARICELARRHGIAVIEDAAHATGMLDSGAWAGTRSAFAAYSFYATKNVASGEGGMLVTNDGALAERVRRLSLHGMSRDAWCRYQQQGSWRYDVLEPGFKYNMPDLAAALACAQLVRLDEMQARRSALARRYAEALEGIPGIEPQRAAAAAGDRHAWCMFAVRIDPQRTGVTRDEVIDKLRDANVGTSVHYIPTHRFTAYRHLATGTLPNTELLAQQVLSLPLYPSMRDEDVDDVVAALRAAVHVRTAA